MYEPEEVPEAEAQATDSDTAEAYVPGAEPEPVAEAEEPQGAEPWAAEEEAPPEVDGTPSMMDALGREDAFEEVLPLPRAGQFDRHHRSGASLGARLVAGLLGYVIGAAVVGGAIWFLYTQGYLPQ